MIVLCVAMPGLAAAADNAVLRSFRSGADLNSVGMIDASEDTEIAAPQAIYAGDGDELFLLDQVNGRVLSFDPKQPTGPTRSLQLPQQLEPTDLVVGKGQIFVWDGDIHALRTSGPEEAPVRGLEEYQTRAIDDQFTVSAFAQMGSQRPTDEGDPSGDNTRSLSQPQPRAPARQSVNSRGRGPVSVNVVLDKDRSGATVEVYGPIQGRTSPLAKFKVKVPDRLGALEFLDIDRSGRMFVLGENIPTSGDAASAFVARYSPAGALEGIYELPLSQTVALSRRFVTVSESGDVYFLRSQHASVDVLGVGFRPLRAKVINVRTRPAASAVPGRRKGRGPIAAMVPLNRQRVIETAFAFERARWRLTPSAYGRDPDTACSGFNRIRRPSYLHGKLGQEVRGIPYCWGCHGALDQILAKIDRGVLAGNVCTRNAPRSDVIGVDCSAFVSAAWGLASHFTTAAIPAIARRLDNPWDLQPGDALNKPGSHVVLFLRFTPDRKAEVMESSPGACNGRVCRNVYPLASLLARGFVPVRFRALAGETVAKVSFPEEQSSKAEVKAKAKAKASHGTVKRETRAQRHRRR